MQPVAAPCRVESASCDLDREGSEANLLNHPPRDPHDDLSLHQPESLIHPSRIKLQPLMSPLEHPTRLPLYTARGYASAHPSFCARTTDQIYLPTGYKPTKISTQEHAPFQGKSGKAPYFDTDSGEEARDNVCQHYNSSTPQKKIG